MGRWEIGGRNRNSKWFTYDEINYYTRGRTNLFYCYYYLYMFTKCICMFVLNDHQILHPSQTTERNSFKCCVCE